MRYVKKPISIEAIQWNGNNFEEIQKFMCEHHVIKTMYNELIIPTLEGEMRAPVDNWIIRGAMGEYYPCRSDIFEKTYEPVEE